MKTKPKTIADLHFNWIFVQNSHLAYSESNKLFLESNPSIKEYKIIRNKYNFNIKNDKNELILCEHFAFNSNELITNSLVEFFSEINFFITTEKECRDLMLIKFVKISDVEYDIILGRIY